MPSSAVPAAKAALLAALKARPNLADVLVTWAHPGNAAAPEFIFLGNVSIEESDRTIGGGIRSESAAIEVYVVVHRDGDDAQSTEQRAYDLKDEVRGAVLEDRSLGIVDGQGILSATAAFESGQVQTFAEVDGYTAQIAPAIVRVDARIR